jgi:predicted nucleotidyltransferase
MTQTNQVLKLHEIISQSGFEHANSVIHTHVGGSAAHGARIGPSSDLDILSVYIQPPNEALGITEFRADGEGGQRYRVQTEGFDWSTAPDTRRNTAEDVDINAYSLRKWAGLAVKGHPEALHCLFVPNMAIRPAMWEKHIRPHTDLFISSWAGRTFLSCAQEQIRRVRESKPTNWKMAMHVARILLEGTELMRLGHISLPNPEKDQLIHIREGKFTLDMWAKQITRLMDELVRARDHSPLPEDVDRRKISDLIANTYLDFYTGGLYPPPTLEI